MTSISRNNKIFRTKQVPFLLTILLAAMAWIVSHSTDRLFEQPILEYKIEKVKQFENKNFQCGSDNEEESYYFRITLISLAQNIRIDSLTAYIRTPGNSELKAGRILESPPSWAQVEAPNCNEKILSYKLKGIQPFTAHIAELVTTSPERPIFHYKSANAVRAKETSLETRIVKNEFHIYSFLLILLLVFFILYVTTGMPNGDV